MEINRGFSAPEGAPPHAGGPEIGRLDEPSMSIIVAEKKSTVALQYADRATEARVMVLSGDAPSLRKHADIESFCFGGAEADGDVVTVAAA